MEIKEFLDKRDFWGENPKTDKLEDFAELCANMHLAVATSNNDAICTYDTEIYKTSKNLLIEAIRAVYPNLPASEIYDVWVDCGESIEYCANVVRWHRRS